MNPSILKSDTEQDNKSENGTQWRKYKIHGVYFYKDKKIYNSPNAKDVKNVNEIKLMGTFITNNNNWNKTLKFQLKEPMHKLSYWEKKEKKASLNLQNIAYTFTNHSSEVFENHIVLSGIST